MQQGTSRSYHAKFLTRKGLDIFLFFSGQQKATDFKLWVADKLEERRATQTTKSRNWRPWELPLEEAFKPS